MRTRVWLSQQAVWDIDSDGRESMPLACAYLKSYAEADPAIRRDVDIRIFNFPGSATTLGMIRRMFGEEVPDVLGMSIFGWNYTTYGHVAETFKKLNPRGWVVLGGTHVANQAKRVCAQFPDVDVVVDGEGERAFLALLRAHLGGRSKHELHDVPGISFQTESSTIVSIPGQRIDNLEEIPSPFLNGSLELTLPDGHFRYDVALMETSRGCPYKCAFCYWGGAVGTKMRAFSVERLREEVELFARHRVADIALCDANFGMTRNDQAFVEILIKAREKYGFPRHVITSWAKNKGPRFFEIVRRMKQKGFHSTFTLALQTLSEPALERMSRHNMRINDWQDLATWLKREKLDVYGEMIWGAPGETYESFVDGYDRLASRISRIACYPLLILPNTGYAESRQLHRLVTWRGDKSDFEYVLSHETMSVEDNVRMHRFLFWARAIGEYATFRYIWTPLDKLAGITHSQVLLSLDLWIDRQTDGASLGLRELRSGVVEKLDAYAVTAAIRYLYVTPEIKPLFARWWEEDILPRIVEAHREFFRQLFRYDLESMPIFGASDCHALGMATETIDLERYFVRELEFDFDVPALTAAIAAGEMHGVVPCHSFTTKLYFKVGWEAYYANHEFTRMFVGKTQSQLLGEQEQQDSCQEPLERSIADTAGAE